jgi:predicted N-acetyltransferase YhbS
MVHIRPMTPEDRSEIAAILKKTPEFEPEEVDVALELIDFYLSDGLASGYYQYIAEDSNELVGYICFGQTPLTMGTWDIYWVAVDPAQKGKGIGRVLIEFAEDKMREAGGRLSIVETAGKPSYENTRQFYYARGYEVVSRISDFYTVGDDKITFLKRLI